MDEYETVGARVREAMRRTGFNNTQFADAIGLELSKFSKSLSEKRRFTSLELARIANVGDVTVDWLLTGVEQRALQFAHRAHEEAVPEADNIATGLVERLRSRFQSLDRLGYGIAVPKIIPASTMWPSSQRGREYAPYVHEILGVEDLGTLDLSELIQVVERELSIQVVIEDLPSQCDGLSYVEGNFRLIVLGTSDAPFRQRFTLGHEIGHILFGDCDNGILEEQIHFDGADKIETQANAFASALFAPREAIESFLDGADVRERFDEMTMHFQLSPSALAIALRNSALISQEDVAALASRQSRESAMATGQAARYGELSMFSGQPRPAWGIAHQLLRAYGAGDITLRPVADVLGWSLEKTENFFDPPVTNLVSVS